MKTFWSRANAYPPIACRLLARTDGRHPRVLTDKEIADAGNLDIQVVWALQWKPSWDGIDLQTMRAFLRGCGMDFEDAKQMRRADQYARKRLIRRLSYLKKDQEWHTRWRVMRDQWLEAVTASHLKHQAKT